MVGELEVVAITLLAAVIASFAQYLFKRAVPKFPANMKGVLSLFKNKLLMIGAAVYVVDLAIYLVALRYGELSFVYPIFASSFVFTLLLSKYGLKEPISAKRAIGVALVVVGIALVALTY